MKKEDEKNSLFYKGEEGKKKNFTIVCYILAFIFLGLAFLFIDPSDFLPLSFFFGLTCLLVRMIKKMIVFYSNHSSNHKKRHKAIQTFSIKNFLFKVSIMTLGQAFFIAYTLYGTGINKPDHPIGQAIVAFFFLGIMIWQDLPSIYQGNKNRKVSEKKGAITLENGVQDKIPFNKTQSHVISDAIISLESISQEIFAIKSPEVQEHLTTLYSLASQAVAEVQQFPQTYDRVRRLMSHYIPRLYLFIKKMQNIEATNMLTSARKARTLKTLQTLITKFKKYAQDVHEPTTTAFDMELDVLESEFKNTL